MKLKTWILACLLVLCTAASGHAVDILSVDIFGPGQSRVNYLVLPARGLAGGGAGYGGKFESVVHKDLSFLPFLRVAGLSEVPGGDPSRGLNAESINFQPLQAGHIDLVTTVGSSGGRIEARVYETYSHKLLLGKAYSGVTNANVPGVADRFCAQLMRILTGKSGFFDSTLAFSKRVRGGKELYTASALGRNLHQITRDGGYNVSPCWSKDGRYIAYTNISDRGQRLGLWNRATRVSQLRRFRGNVAISPTFTPGDRIAISLATNGDPDIYLLNRSFRPVKSLAPSWGINVSPSFDLSGRTMVFCSGRLGGPQIFLLDLSSGSVRRVTYSGRYNTRPSLSPDGRFVVFARLTSGGQRIFIHDLTTGQERQISFGPGNDVDPSFDPDGYFVSFASTRQGGSKIYMTTRFGDPAHLIPTGRGEAFAPAWGPAPALN